MPGRIPFRVNIMRQGVPIVAIGLMLLGISGWSAPHAKEFAEKAQGATQVDTLMNLANMMDASVKAARGGTGPDQPLNDLPNQLHAFDNNLCGVEQGLRRQSAPALAVTQSKELRAILKRVGKFQVAQPQRAQHLDLFSAEVQALHATLPHHLEPGGSAFIWHHRHQRRSLKPNVKIGTGWHQAGRNGMSSSTGP
jgi:hypothetical protein